MQSFDTRLEEWLLKRRHRWVPMPLSTRDKDSIMGAWCAHLEGLAADAIEKGLLGTTNKKEGGVILRKVIKELKGRKK